MTLVAEKDDLKRQEREINQRLNAIRDAERYEENKALVGKTFKYRNNFSCPEKPSDYWWLYAKVQKVAKDGYLTVFMFETDKYGQITIRTDKYKFHMNDGYRPIPVSEFNKAWRAIQKKIVGTKP